MLLQANCKDCTKPNNHDTQFIIILVCFGFICLDQVENILWENDSLGNMVFLSLIPHSKHIQVFWKEMEQYVHSISKVNCTAKLAIIGKLYHQKKYFDSFIWTWNNDWILESQDCLDFIEGMVGENASVVVMCKACIWVVK